MEIIASGLGLLEGPVNRQDGSLVVTSMDQGRLYRVADGGAELFADTGGGANGATEWSDGTIFVAQNGGLAPPWNKLRCPAGVQVAHPDGRIETFGEGMVSPNDLCFGPDGLLYVTDPTRKPERDDGRIWRCDPLTRRCELLLHCDWYPNGIGFSAEDDVVYVADTRHGRMVRFPLHDIRNETLEHVLDLDHGHPDGFAFDAAGDLLVACPSFEPEGGDVQVYRDGRLIEVIKPGTSKLYTNLCISADAVLYLCDSDNGDVLTAPWRAPGLPLHPFRP